MYMCIYVWVYTYRCIYIHKCGVEGSGVIVIVSGQRAGNRTGILVWQESARCGSREWHEGGGERLKGGGERGGGAVCKSLLFHKRTPTTFLFVSLSCWLSFSFSPPRPSSSPFLPSCLFVQSLAMFLFVHCPRTALIINVCACIYMFILITCTSENYHDIVMCACVCVCEVFRVRIYMCICKWREHTMCVCLCVCTAFVQEFIYNKVCTRKERFNRYSTLSITNCILGYANF